MNTVIRIFWHFAENKNAKRKWIICFPERYRTISGWVGFFWVGFLFFFLTHSFAISRQLLFKTYLNMYERLLKSHVHFQLEHEPGLWQNSYKKILNSQHKPAEKTYSDNCLVFLQYRENGCPTGTYLWSSNADLYCYNQVRCRRATNWETLYLDLF